MNIININQVKIENYRFKLKIKKFNYILQINSKT